MVKITKTLKLLIIGIIFLLGAYFTANFTHKDFVETFINERKECYDLLVKEIIYFINQNLHMFLSKSYTI